MAGERLGRGFSPQGSVPRQPSPYHYLELLDVAQSLGNEEALISFEDEGNDMPGKVPLHSTPLLGITDLWKQQGYSSTFASNSLDENKSLRAIDTSQKPVSGNPTPQSLLDADFDSPPSQIQVARETNRPKPPATIEDEADLENFLSPTGVNYPPINPYTFSQSPARAVVSRSQTVLDSGDTPAESSTSKAVQPPTTTSEKEKKHLCGHCDKYQSDSYYCNLCDTTYCGGCWNKMGPHRTGKMGPGGIPHEKTDQVIADKLRATLEASPSDLEQDELFQNDENTAWFGVVKDESGDSIFYDYGRYADIITEIVRATGPRQHGSRFPGLVCFVGETGK